MISKAQIDLLLFLLLNKNLSRLEICFCMGLNDLELSELFHHLLKEGDVEMQGSYWKLNRTAASIKTQPKRLISTKDWKLHLFLHKIPCSAEKLSALLNLSQKKTSDLLKQHKDRGFVSQEGSNYYSNLRSPQHYHVLPSELVLPLESNKKIKTRKEKRWIVFFSFCCILGLIFILYPQPQPLIRSELKAKTYELSASSSPSLNIQEYLNHTHKSSLQHICEAHQRHCATQWGSGLTCVIFGIEHTEQSWIEHLSEKGLQ